MFFFTELTVPPQAAGVFKYLKDAHTDANISSQRECLLPENANMLFLIKYSKSLYDILK